MLTEKDFRLSEVGCDILEIFFFFLAASCLFGMNSSVNYLLIFSLAYSHQTPGILGRLLVFEGRSLQSLLGVLCPVLGLFTVGLHRKTTV